MADTSKINEATKRHLKEVFTRRLRQEKILGKGKPHSSFEGQAATAIRKYKKELGLKGGGKATRGLGKAFMKGGKVK